MKQYIIKGGRPLQGEVQIGEKCSTGYHRCRNYGRRAGFDRKSSGGR